MEFMLQGVQPGELIGRIKGEFWIGGWKQTACITALQQHQCANNAWL